MKPFDEDIAVTRTTLFGGLSSVRARIITGFGLLIVILGLVVAGAFWLALKHESDLDAMEQHSNTVSLLQDAKAIGTLQVLVAERFILTGDQLLSAGIQHYKAQSQAAALQARQNLELEGYRQDGARLGEIIDGFNAKFEPVISLSESGDREGALAALQTATPELQRLGTEFDGLATIERQRAADLKDEADNTAELATKLLLTSGILGAVLGVAASYFIARSILKPLSTLESTAKAIATGDLDARAERTGPVEFARLGQTLNAMLAKLQERESDLRLSNDELRQRNRQLLEARSQAATDSLTSLPNHRAFHEKIREEVQLAQERDETLGLIMLDIDGFKTVNDSLGHLAGDDILRQFAQTFAETVGKDCAYRYGGDEFAVLLAGTDEEKTAEAAERLRQAVARPRRGGAGTVTVSLGVAAFPSTAKSAEELIYTADAAMYWAKSAGKNLVGRWEIVAGATSDGRQPWPAAGRHPQVPDVTAGLLAALAAKDPTTSEHSQHCSSYSTQLAVELGLPQKEQSTVALAALLHDIGKLAIPDEVLFKTGPLNEEEWAKMKEHPIAATQVLGQFLAVAEAMPAILHHHEHFDGSGYPDGLTGSHIPLASRILLVTDAYDAMTSDRPYRKAMSPAEAIAELERNSGSQFDPRVVEAFLQLLAGDGVRHAHAADIPIER